MGADALSRLPDNAELVGALMVAPVNVLRIATDPTWIQRIKEGYKADTWYRKLSEAKGFSGIRKENGLWYVGTRLMIPRVQDIRKGLFHLAHDARGHFGFDKSYAALQDSYYWPNMQKEIETLYIPSCEHCQWNKSSTCKLTGPLHPLPVPNNHRDSVATDFIGPLPEDSGFNIIATFTNCLGADIRLVPTRMDITPEDFAVIFFNNWYCENGLPLEIVLDRDHIFVSKFWKSLHALTGIKLKMLTAYHPETDGSSEYTNKTIIQVLRYHVSQNQKNWIAALPKVGFDLMGSVNASTGLALFQLHLGHNPRLIHPLVKLHAPTTGDSPLRMTQCLVEQFCTDMATAKDNLMQTKIAQAIASALHCRSERAYKEGDLVILSTMHRRRDYMQKGDKCVAKFMVRYDRPYKILWGFLDSSVYTLELPATMNIFPTFHAR